MNRPSHTAQQSNSLFDRSTFRGTAAAERFKTEWKLTGQPPEIGAFLPDATAIRQAALVELIKIDLEHRWLHTDVPKLLADYCAQYPELTSDTLPADLVYDEFVFRRHRGHGVSAAGYLREYPTQAAQLARLMGVEDEATVRTDEAPTTAAAAPTDPLQSVDVGQRVDEFDLLTSLGSGAFARVFLARQRSMQRLVAVKISEDHGTEPQTLAQLDHDYIVRVFDQRILPQVGLKLLYMQYLPGGTLLDVLYRLRKTPWTPDRTGRVLLDAIDDVLASRGELRPTDSSVRTEIARLSWPETIAWLGRRLAEAIDYAARTSVLHRDIKPANVLLTAEGVPKLADFNISFSGKLPDTSPVAYFGGSLSYMSPEQLAALHPGYSTTPADLDTRSDMYSLGVVLWELLTGRKPFTSPRSVNTASTLLPADPNDRATLDAMLAARAEGVSAEALAYLPPDTPATLRRILLTCLAPDRDDRWSSGAELAQQFDIALNPPARTLVDPPPGSWAYRLRPWSILIMELGVVVPNLLASYLTYFTSRALVIDRLGPQAQDRFDVLWLGVTAISFPVGALLILYMRRYLVLVPHGLRKGRTYDASTMARARTDAVLLGDRVVVVLCGIWIVCAVAWAIAMAIAIGDIPPRGYVYFFACVLVCAAIATTYPFFLVTFYGIRCLYPTFLPHGEVSGADSERMRRVHRRSIRYLAVAAAIPLVGVAGATFIPLDEIGSVIVAIRVLCIGGIAAFMGAYWLFRKVEGDLTTLEGVTSTRSESIRET